MELELRYVYEVYRQGSFSKAAANLFVTQPAVSLAVSKAEAQIGMPIFDRKTRPFSLTPAGKACIEMIEASLAIEQDTKKKYEDLLGLRTGSIRIGGTALVNAYVLPRYIFEFQEKYPGISLSLIDGSAYEMEEKLKGNEVDVIFSSNPEYIRENADYPGFKDEVLLAVPASFAINERMRDYALTASDVLEGKHWKEGWPTISLQDFKDLSYISIGADLPHRYDRLAALFQEAGIVPNIRFCVPQQVTGYYLAEAGCAATIVSRDLIRHDSKLVYYKLDSPLTQRVFRMLVLKDRYIPHAVRAFIDYCEEHMR